MTPPMKFLDQVNRNTSRHCADKNVIQYIAYGALLIDDAQETIAKSDDSSRVSAARLHPIGEVS